MSFGICHLSLIPIRKEASDRAEMVTQLLFGQPYTILIREERWARIRVEQDAYEGFIDHRQICEISGSDFERIASADPSISASESRVKSSDGSQKLLPMGSLLPFYSNGRIRVDNEDYSGDFNLASLSKDDVEVYTNLFLGAPYLWGGKSLYGIDCSGFSQVVMSMCGIKIRRDASQQAEEGDAVHLLDEALNGDLAFFDNENGSITHVGIILKRSGIFEIIHASGMVRIDLLDHQGIFQRDEKKYSHQLRTIRRY